MVKKNTCVFISGQGSNLKNLILRSRDYTFPLKVKLVVSNNKNAKGIIYAKKNSIPYMILNTKLRSNDNHILKTLEEKKISIICLAGYMKIISKDFINKFGKKIVNIHPSLLPKYKGLNTHKRAIENKDKFSGCTVHLVSSKLDSGKIILQKKVQIAKNETEKSLDKKVIQQEHKIYPAAILKIFN